MARVLTQVISLFHSLLFQMPGDGCEMDEE